MSEPLDSPPVLNEVPETVVQKPVGECLREARETRGLQVADVAQTLKLGVRQVEALERGDWQVLPGHTFIRGFVRNYARLVQIDSAGLMAQLDQVLVKPTATLDVHEMRPAAMPQVSGGGLRRDRRFVFWGAAALVLAALLYGFLPADLSVLRDGVQSLLDSLSRKEAPAVQEAPAPASAPAPAVPEPVFPPGSTPQQVMNPQAVVPESVRPSAGGEVTAQAEAPQLRFVVEKNSWIEVRDRDNKPLFSQRMAAGSEQSVSGQGPFSVSIGYAPGVRLFWQGQPVDLVPHTRGDVARLVLE